MNFPSDEVRKKVLYHIGVWLMVLIPVLLYWGNPDNSLHQKFLDSGMTLMEWLVLGVVLNTGVEAASTAYFERK